jgi:hypothetical protein
MAPNFLRWSLPALLTRKLTIRKVKQAGPAAGNTAQTSYHAVSIIPGENSCAAAHRFTGRRYLSQQAPRLPLPTCDAFHCTCRFRHHKDRRAGPRRRSDIGLLSGAWTGPEKRRSGGRRAEDM